MASITRSQLVQLVEKVLASHMSSDLFQFSDNIAQERFKFPLPLRVTHKFDEFYFDVYYGSNNYGTTWTLAMGLALTADQARHLVALTTDFTKRIFPKLLE